MWFPIQFLFLCLSVDAHNILIEFILFSMRKLSQTDENKPKQSKMGKQRRTKRREKKRKENMGWLCYGHITYVWHPGIKSIILNEGRDVQWRPAIDPWNNLSLCLQRKRWRKRNGFETKFSQKKHDLWIWDSNWNGNGLWEEFTRGKPQLFRLEKGEKRGGGGQANRVEPVSKFSPFHWAICGLRVQCFHWIFVSILGMSGVCLHTALLRLKNCCLPC